MHGNVVLLRTLVPLVGVLGLACKDPKAAESGGVSVDTESLDFGEVALGQEAQERFTVVNGREDEVSILSASLVEGRSAAWDIAAPSGDGTMLPGVESTYVVTFAPYEVGESAGRVQVRLQTADGQESFYVSLRGVGGQSIVDADGDGVSPSEGDCDDGDASVYPGAPEACDGKDNDCDGSVPLDEADDDYDGSRVCDGDCDDSDERTRPGIAEWCDGAEKDNDCNGVVEDWLDEDGDGYAICEDDCDDADPLRFTGNPEICDLVDNDCSGFVDDIDDDGDGYSPCAAGGDCDDADDEAYPVIVDISFEEDGNGTPEEPYNTLSDGLANLDDICRTLVLMPGEYTMNLAWSDGELQINGGGTRPGDVTLTSAVDDESGEPTGRILDVTGGSSVGLVNLTLTGGGAPVDGGAIKASGSDLYLSGVVIAANRANGDGGAVAISSGQLTIEDSVFRNNQAGDDGGALAVVDGGLDDQGSTYEDNTAGARGGAAFVSAAGVSIVGSTIEDNGASDDGGGVVVVQPASLRVEGNRFWLNTAGLAGGGLSLVGVDVEQGVVRNNWFHDNLAGQTGGGLEVSGNRAGFVLANNTFGCNRATGEGADVHVDASTATDLWILANAAAFSTGDSSVYVTPGAGATVDWNTGYGVTSNVNFDVEGTTGGDENAQTNPAFVQWDCDPAVADITPGAGSPLIDSGPEAPTGPAWYTAWVDGDGSRNDRGATGGPGVTP
jgi:hypothetical protein